MYFSVSPYNCDPYEEGCINNGKKVKNNPGGGGSRYSSADKEELNFSVQQLNSSQVSLWPNPVNDVLQVEYKNPSSSPTNLAVFNTAGQQIHVEPKVKSFNNSQYFTINTQDFIPGIYFLKLNGEEGVKTLSFSKNP